MPPNWQKIAQQKPAPPPNWQKIAQQKPAPPPVPQIKSHLPLLQQNVVQKATPLQPQQNLLHNKPLVVVPQPIVQKPKLVVPPPIKAQPPLPQQNVAQKAKPPAQPDVGPNAGPFTLVLYRSETTKHPPWQDRVRDGISVWKPWMVDTGHIHVPTLFNRVRQDIKEFFLSKVSWEKADFDKKILEQGYVNKVLDVYARHLTVDSPKTSVPFSRDPNAKYDLDYDYVVHVENAYTFYWGPGLSFGKPALFSVYPVTAHYIVLNGPSLDKSTILAFGQKNLGMSGFWEVDFFTTAKSVVKCTCVIKNHPDFGKVMFEKPQ